jgi:hypothetical protein
MVLLKARVGGVRGCATVVCLCVARAAGLESTTLYAPLTSLSLCGNNLSQLSAIESAKLDLGLAYSINSLFWVYLCAQGVSPRDHPVKTELVSVCLLCSQHFLSSLPASECWCGHTCLVAPPTFTNDRRRLSARRCSHGSACYFVETLF